MNGLCNLDATCRDYSLAPAGDLIRFWMSKVRVAAGHPGDEGIHVNAVVIKSIF